MKLRIDSIRTGSLVDGPGRRVVLFVQGCSLGCKGCQNDHLWSTNGGRVENVADVANILAMLSVWNNGNVTLSGGEIFQQPAALAELVVSLRALGVSNIVAYSGYTWEELHDPHHPAAPFLKGILENINILVDGRFIARRDDPLIYWRGSRNQRPIDVQRTLKQDQLVILDWDNPVVSIDQNGGILFPVGLTHYFDDIGQVRITRRCGEIANGLA